MFDGEEIYRRVDEIRLARGYSIYRMAELAEIPVNTVYGWRDKKSMPTLSTINAIAKAFEIDPLVLLVGEEGVAARSEEDRALLALYHALTAEQKGSLMAMLRSFAVND